jgi:multifunctional methyltransferase subunit TRM112
MRLLTHNMLQCHVKGCTSNNYPLALSNCTLETMDVEFELAFVEGMLAKLDYAALYNTCIDLGMQIPSEVPEVPDEEFLIGLGRVLMKVRVLEGDMTCRGCGHVYPIKNAIPNMLLEEKEV